MPVTKDALLKQVADCHVRVQLLRDLKNDVISCVDNTCEHISAKIERIAVAADNATAEEIKTMHLTLRTARNVVREYEDALERVRMLQEDDDLISPPSSYTLVSVGTERMDEIIRQTSAMNRRAKQIRRDSIANDPTEALVDFELDHPPAASLTSDRAMRRPIGSNSAAGVATDRKVVVEESVPPGATSACGRETAESSVQVLATKKAWYKPVYTKLNPPSLSGSDVSSMYVPSATCVSPVQSPLIVFERNSEEMKVLSNEVLPAEISTKLSTTPVEETATAIEKDIEERKSVSSKTDLADGPATAAASTGSTGMNASAADASDYVGIVSKGTGNVDDCCQMSVELTASRDIFLECSLSNALHPSLFWIQLFNSNIDEIDDEMMRALESMKTALSNPKVGDYCAAPIEEDDELMRRAKILEIKDNSLGTCFAKVLYIDTGKVEWIATKALMVMPPRIRHFLRQACPCILADVEPVSGVWEETVITAFRELCVADENTRLFVKALDKGAPPAINTVSLYRVKNKDMSKIETVSISLIRAGMGKVRRADRRLPMNAFPAESGEPIGGRDPPDVIDGWRCVVKVLEKEPDPTDEGGGVSPGLTAAIAIAQQRTMPTITQGRVQPLELPNLVNADGIIYFRVNEVVSPGEFYIQIRDGNGRNDRLDKLTIELNSFYSNPVNHVLLSRNSTQFAVVRYPVDEQTAFRRILIRDWHTPSGMDTKDYRVNSSVMAAFIDEGFCRRLETRDMFVLDEKFCTLPAQASFCKLCGCYPNTVSNNWDRNSTDIFRALTMTGKPLLKAIVASEKQPYELIIYAMEEDGSETIINRKMVEAKHARGDIAF